MYHITGEPRLLHGQIAAIRPGRQHWAIFDVGTIMAELRREEVREDRPEQAQVSGCLFCGKPLSANSRMTRHYCNDRCRVADHRRRRRTSRSEALSREQTEALHEMWKDVSISSQCFTMLGEIVVDELYAGNTLLTACSAQPDRESRAGASFDFILVAYTPLSAWMQAVALSLLSITCTPSGMRSSAKIILPNGQDGHVKSVQEWVEDPDQPGRSARVSLLTLI